MNKSLLVAGVLSVAAAAPAMAYDINPCALPPCTTSVKSPLPGTNVLPGDDGLYHVLDGVRISNDRFKNGQGVEYRLVLVRDTGITGTSLTEAAMYREQAQFAYWGEGGGVVITDTPVYSIDTVVTDPSSGTVTLRLVDTKAKGKSIK